jgi:hypothetical protein
LKNFTIKREKKRELRFIAHQDAMRDEFDGLRFLRSEGRPEDELVGAQFQHGFST